MKRRLHIRREDIDDGLPKDPQECPIARVLQRRFTDQYHSASAVKVSVGHAFIRLYFRGGTRWQCRLPRNVSAWIIRFDDGKVVTPLKFTAEFERMEPGQVL